MIENFFDLLRIITNVGATSSAMLRTTQFIVLKLTIERLNPNLTNNGHTINILPIIIIIKVNNDTLKLIIKLKLLNI